jgi:nucleoid-associated protein YgaU
MGLIEFALEAGKKLFGGDAAAAAPTTDETVLSKRAVALEQHVQALGLAVDGLKIKVAQDTAWVRGTVPTQAAAELVALAVGNTAGIAKVENQLEVKAVEPPARLYTVRRGDTLSAISKQLYGDAGKYRLIFEANKPMLKDPDEIYPGQVLRIPGAP